MTPPPITFIFMLTRDDRTVADARRHLDTALAAGVRHIGFKDVGLPLDALRDLARAIRDGGAKSYLEVVSLDAAAEVASARAAVAMEVDHLLGGTRPEAVLPVIAGAPIRYHPFPGRVTGHPSVLEGDQAEIVASAAALAAHEGVHGLDLLAWRAACACEALIAAVCAAAGKPVIVAGSVDHPDRIAAARRGRASAFTIGTAALDGRFPAASPRLPDQLAAILAAAGGD